MKPADSPFPPDGRRLNLDLAAGLAFPLAITGPRQWLAAMALIALTACGGDDSPPPNHAPTAVIASVPLVRVGSSVSLDATASRDADGDALSFAWALANRPTGSAAVLANADAARPSLLPDRAGTYSLTLTVSDGTRSSPAASIDLVAADPAVPTRLAVIGSASSTVVQHAAIAAGFQVRVTNAFGEPVSRVAVTFSPSAENPARPPIVQTTAEDGEASAGLVRGNPRPWSWIDFFHVAGRQHIVASAAGVAPVTFDIDVTSTPHDFDGVYACSSSPLQFTISNGSVSRWGLSPFDQIMGQFDEGSGVLQVTEIPASDSLRRYQADARIVIDSSRNASAQGTRASYRGVMLVFVVDWSCTRF